MNRVGSFAAILLMLGSVAVARAQMLGADPLTVTVTPANPAPYQNITIAPQSTVVDLSASTVTVTVNGTVIATGSGTTPVSTTVGGPGSVTNIDVSVSGPDGSFDKQLAIRPESVALVEEPLSTTHPFYAGGNLVAPNGRVRLIAFADFYDGATHVSPDSLVYTWKLGDQLLEDYSGIGKSVLSADAPVQYRDATISVTVSTQDGTLAGSASVAISPVSPQLLIYTDGALTGPDFDETASQPFTMTDTEASFRAVPYFFASLPSLTWSVNGAANGTEPVVTVRTTGSSAGTAVLSASANSADNSQSAEDSRTINYGGNSSGGSIFGL